MTHKTIHIFSTCNFATHTSPIYKQQTNLTSTCQQQKSIFLTFLITWTSFKNDGAIVMALRVAASVGNLPPWHHRRCRADWNAAEACLSHRLTVMGWRTQSVAPMKQPCRDVRIILVTNFLLLVWHKKCRHYNRVFKVYESICSVCCHQKKGLELQLFGTPPVLFNYLIPRFQMTVPSQESKNHDFKHFEFSDFTRDPGVLKLWPIDSFW